MPKYETLFFCKTTVNVLQGTALLSLAGCADVNWHSSFIHLQVGTDKQNQMKEGIFEKNQGLTHDHELSATASAPSRKLSDVRIIINRCGANYKTKAMICLQQTL